MLELEREEDAAAAAAAVATSFFLLLPEEGARGGLTIPIAFLARLVGVSGTGVEWKLREPRLETGVGGVTPLCLALAAPTRAASACSSSEASASKRAQLFSVVMPTDSGLPGAAVLTDE